MLSYCRATLFDRSLLGQPLEFFKQRDIGWSNLLYIVTAFIVPCSLDNWYFQCNFGLFLILYSCKTRLAKKNNFFLSVWSKFGMVAVLSLDQRQPSVNGSAQQERASSLASCHTGYQVILFDRYCVQGLHLRNTFIILYPSNRMLIMPVHDKHQPKFPLFQGCVCQGSHILYWTGSTVHPKTEG